VRSYPTSTAVYLSDGILRDEETTIGVQFREQSLIPLRECSIPAILEDLKVISDILCGPRIGGLKPVMYSLFSFRGLSN
jgi:hypothetical protein